MSVRELSSSPRHELPVEETVAGEVQKLRASEERLQLENDHLRESLATLEGARDEYFALYDDAPVALLTLDGNGIIKHANLAWARLLGLDLGRVLGRTLRTFVNVEDRPLLSQLLREKYATASAACNLRLVVTADTLLPVRLLTGDFGSLVKIAVLDQREQQQLAEENDKLRQSAQLARKDNDSKDQFIAMLSHELRTPLTPILAAASAFKEDPGVPDDLRAVFERIAVQATAEARLIDDLLDANGILRGKMSVERETLDVLALLQECVESVRPLADAKLHVLELSLESEERHVFGDAARLRQVFTNLLRNAIKYTPQAGRIRVNSWNGPGRVVIDIEDNGVGFETTSIPRLFSPFDQLRDSNAPAGGLGLGLAISRGLGGTPRRPHRRRQPRPRAWRSFRCGVTNYQ
jgi:signal transduction histidine kinase